MLLATGAAWEGFDFPGDCVSLLIIPRLPFAYPDARKERELEKYPSLHAFIREVAVPEMQIKLRQGFGRAIRTESDTCVIAILDERACRGRRYAQAVSEALPEMRRTGSLREVTRFLREKKPESYLRWEEDDAKKELQYRLAVRMLEHLAEIGLLSAEELSYAKRLAREKYSPQTVWE